MRNLLASVANSNQIHTRQALGEASSTKTDFLSMLAHELRDPLLPLSNAVHLLSMPGLDRASFEKALAIMHRQLSQLARLVDDLFDFARIGEDKLILRKQWVAVATILDAALDVSMPRIESAGLQLHVDIRPGQLEVCADTGRLTQTVANLLNNSSKFTPRGGDIWVKCCRTGDSTVLTVRDSGIGLERDLLPEVFTPFHQATCEAASNRGLGLGLPIAKRIVEMHGGRIAAASDGPGKGSTFTVTLPDPLAL
jgi:signal transduction histidine kinase